VRSSNTNSASAMVSMTATTQLARSPNSSTATAPSSAPPKNPEITAPNRRARVPASRSCSTTRWNAAIAMLRRFPVVMVVLNGESTSTRKVVTCTPAT